MQQGSTLPTRSTWSRSVMTTPSRFGGPGQRSGSYALTLKPLRSKQTNLQGNSESVKVLKRSRVQWNLRNHLSVITRTNANNLEMQSCFAPPPFFDENLSHSFQLFFQYTHSPKCWYLYYFFLCINKPILLLYMYDN